MVPYAIHVLHALLEAQVFYILPHSRFRAQAPSLLPRETFVTDEQDYSRSVSAAKKKGRPSKRDRIRKAKDALASLDKYVERNTVLSQSLTTRSSPVASDGPPLQTHALLNQPPVTTLHALRAHKAALLTTLGVDSPKSLFSQAGPSSVGMDALERSNNAVLGRLKQIDAMAAEKGLEVGGEGGEKTGLVRVENAVRELREQSGIGAKGGILSLLDGAGVEPAGRYDERDSS